MSLDVPTLLVVLALMCQIAALSFIGAWVRRRPERHVILWASALELAAVSCVLLLLRNRIPDLLSIDLANACSLLALGLAWNGSRAFNSRPVRWLPALAAPAIWLILMRDPSIAQSLPLRITVISLLSGVLSLAIAWESWVKAKDTLFWRGPFALIPIVHVVFLSVRSAVALEVDLPADLLQGGVLLGVSILEPILMMFAATIIGLLMIDERLKNVLKQAASTDGLTGLLNHGAFMDRARARAASIQRAESATMLLFDLDRFKQLNDRHGHAAGDAALKCFAGLLHRSVGGSELVGRVGGEEFAALLVGVDTGEGWQLAERVRRDLAAQPILHGGRGIAVTVSVGVAAAEGPDVDFERLMMAADEALYSAKRGGRDLVFQAAS